MSNVFHSPHTLKNLRVTVLGLGRFGGGVGVTKWLCRQGAKVTVSDALAADQLADSVLALAGCDATLHLGLHDDADFTQADFLVVNPAVPKESPLLALAATAGVPRTSEINLFIERCPATIVGITGSVGKSTTTAMVGRILAKRFTTHVGGNIGGSLLQTLDQIQSNHVVVLELSSFQLEDLPIIGISPHIALVTNLKPNHLDRHGTMQAYGDAKKNLFAFQKPSDVLILNAADEPTRAWAADAPGRVEYFDPTIAASASFSGRRHDGLPAAQSDLFELTVPGAHNQGNAQAAFAVAREMGIDRPTAQEALRDFPGLPHRLQFVCEREGVRYYNDSKCTTPEGAIVALEAFAPGKAVIIVGGYDKHVSFEAMGKSLAARAKAVIAIGATKDQIVTAVEQASSTKQPVIVKCETFADAVAAAQAIAASGDAVLLSPACASYDMFQNYEKRGELFVELVTK